MTTRVSRFPRTDRRDQLGDVLRARYNLRIAEARTRQTAVPFDPATLDQLGVSVHEYIGTAHALAQLLGREPSDGAELLDLISDVLEVIR